MSSPEEKPIVIPVDDSQNSLNAMKHLAFLFNARSGLKFVFIHIIPTLPPDFLEELGQDRDALSRLKALEENNLRAAEELLDNARQGFLQMGFSPGALETVCRIKKAGIARDICNYSNEIKAGAICIGTPARNRITAFFFGEISSKLQDFCRDRPVWLVKKPSLSRNILVAVDNSKNALRAVMHAGAMLSTTDCAITLLHVKRNLNRYLTPEVIAGYPDFQRLWHKSSGRSAAPFMEKAEKILRRKGFDSERLTIRNIEAGNGVAGKIIHMAEGISASMIFMGRRGYSDVAEYAMGSVARKVVDRMPRGTVCLVP